jgi:hypothetical protein
MIGSTVVLRIVKTLFPLLEPSGQVTNPSPSAARTGAVEDAVGASDPHPTSARPPTPAMSTAATPRVDRFIATWP